jgi:hypothetical protein
MYSVIAPTITTYINCYFLFVDVIVERSIQFISMSGFADVDDYYSISTKWNFNSESIKLSKNLMKTTFINYILNLKY